MARPRQQPGLGPGDLPAVAGGRVRGWQDPVALGPRRHDGRGFVRSGAFPVVGDVPERRPAGGRGAEGQGRGRMRQPRVAHGVLEEPANAPGDGLARIPPAGRRQGDDTARPATRGEHDAERPDLQHVELSVECVGDVGEGANVTGERWSAVMGQETR
ncbi:hypothetical protein ACWGE0_06480 [Lentzea sp. NPDC054927]